jgi:hypothetical protein
MHKRSSLIAALLLALGAAPGAAQSSLSAPCQAEIPSDAALAREICLMAAQAVESAQPQLGILTAGGNPTLGTASAGGLRFGFMPRVSATARLNLVFIRLPDILAEQVGGAGQRLNQTLGLPAPALGATATVGVFPGFSPLPLVGGVGAVDLIGGATWLPFRALGLDGFGEEAPDISWGAGVRLGLLRESFLMPGVSLSLMHRRLGHVRFGNVCPSPVQSGPVTQGDGYTRESGLCPGGGDPAEFEFDLRSWNTRAAVSKRLLGIGLTAGVGHDRHASGVGFGFETPDEMLATDYVRFREMELTSGRTSLFANASFTVLIATLAVEAGWMQGAEAVPGFPGTADFDPRGGTFFGSLGARLSF